MKSQICIVILVFLTIGLYACSASDQIDYSSANVLTTNDNLGEVSSDDLPTQSSSTSRITTDSGDKLPDYDQSTLLKVYQAKDLESFKSKIKDKTKIKDSLPDNYIYTIPQKIDYSYSYEYCPELGVIKIMCTNNADKSKTRNYRWAYNQKSIKMVETSLHEGVFTEVVIDGQKYYYKESKTDFIDKNDDTKKEPFLTIIWSIDNRYILLTLGNTSFSKDIVLDACKTIYKEPLQ